MKNLSLSLFRILNLISHLNVFLSSDMKNYLRNWNLLLFLLLSSIFLLLKKEDLKNYDQEIRRRGCKKTSAFTWKRDRCAHRSQPGPFFIVLPSSLAFSYVGFIYPEIHIDEQNIDYVYLIYLDKYLYLFYLFVKEKE